MNVSDWTYKAYPVVNYTDDGKDKRVYIDMRAGIDLSKSDRFKFESESNLIDMLQDYVFEDCFCYNPSYNTTNWSGGFVLFRFKDKRQEFGSKDDIVFLRVNMTPKNDNGEPEDDGSDLTDEDKQAVKLTYCFRQ